jgi:hypothetical protein
VVEASRWCARAWRSLDCDGPAAHNGIGASCALVLHLGRCEEPTNLDRQPVHFRYGILVDVQMDEQDDPALDHGEGLGNDDGAPPQSGDPMPLLSVGAFHGDGRGA